ncbi:MAG: methionyl-tRNA formyltransferase [Candidatus Colwellbacteria bacterium CG10_big_fil_rev_8_21_14_0_10_41_28]|uniref:methionyl-tRNA formyltransferase n=1 Tax=Candidatus Colwellbacteria bacterium CG10_big_fil_rev_8_21_14_0_10_41_28 TaxID=1974539 RepID=A0A2H0VHA7_9BACT|nr:MAG: methionyl-tRNA formyltransferase [Candidatus Colwellbacteria bacterium CG10_big_fil_rev_8_21_14_0_10_41_28]
MKFVFFGTPDIASAVLRGLVEKDIVPGALVCNPDRPVGRDRVIAPPSTKKFILDNKFDTKVYQPKDKKELSSLAKEEFGDYEFGLVLAYNKIIPKEVIDIFPKGIIGIHPSLLPELRGPSPIRTAILDGKAHTGVTLYLLDEKMDNGPIIASKKVLIGKDNLKKLTDKIIDVAIELCLEEIPKYIDGSLHPVSQNHTEATYSGFFKTDDAFIKEKDLENALIGDDRLTESILRKIRALNPEPGVYTFMDGKRTKILDAKKDGIKLVLEEIQVEGKKPISLN